MIGESEVGILSQLARLSLNEAEKKSLHRDLESILNYISQLSEIQAAHLAKQDLGLVKNVMRSDVPSDILDSDPDELLKAAPETMDNFVAVKKILDNKGV